MSPLSTRVAPVVSWLRLSNPGRLPPQVDAAVGHQDDGSEVLIRLIHLAILVLFGTLYFASPAPGNNTTFRPVPVVLALYVATAAFMLGWALRRRLPEWAVLGSIALDVALLMLLIWSFHLQYLQPPAFYLKAPTFSYVFILIALRALRLQSRFVLAAGILAAAGWSCLAVYAIAARDPAGAVTRDYVQYLTSNAILVGAEIDKIVSILVVTAVLWLALTRGRALLVRSVAESAAAANLSRFFDAPLAMRIRQSDEAGLNRATSRNAAILFVDLRGFTRRAARMKPQDVMALLGAYQREVVALVRKHGGNVDKFLGDGIMATFGAVTESETDAADGMRCMDAIIEAAETWPGSDGPLKVLGARSIGASVVAGPVVFGAVGDDERLEFTVIGTSVNLAAKLEKHNKVVGSRALTDVATYERARRQGYQPNGVAKPVRGPPETGGEDRCLVMH